MEAPDSVAKSDSVISLSSVLISTITPSLISSDQPKLASSITTPKIISESTPSPSTSSTISNDLDSAENSSVVPDVSAPERGLSRGQITAIIASVVSVTVLLVAISIAVRCFVVRRRLYNIEELPKRNLRMSPAGIVSQTEQGYKSATRTSVADSNRSSIWGDMGHSVVPIPLNDDVWDSRHWPLPPGHSERYTFFSERSSTSIDESLEIEQERGGGQNGNLDIQDRNQVITRRELATRSRCDSIWGISEAGIAR
ncbi:hypothetical protein F4805DRAFT_385605 [Annulohypoxylon moriforme]|nr:hypothetical protein F4805DRAFT_385605 [Annulohypoxylon moriforme]